MSYEEGSSSHAVYNQEIYTEETEPMDQAFQNLLHCVINLNDNVNFSPIYMVPSRLREVNPSSFTPRVVSVGPFHKGQRNLKSMESKKATYLSELLSSVGSKEKIPKEKMLKECVQKVRGSIDEIRTYYFGMKPYTDDELVQIMVLDACFILKFINNISIEGNLFSDNRLRSRNIALDLVLLENQIPFFVLQDIYDLTIQKLQPEKSLTTMLKDILDHVNSFEEPLVDNIIVGTETTHYHILGLLHRFYKPISFKLPKISVIPTAYSAEELDKVGVKIRPNRNLTWPMAMEFEFSLTSHKPTLKIPVVRVDDFFEVVLRNLIAFEQYSPVDNYVTSYAMAMDMLISTPVDIAKLGKSGVIVSHLGSNEKASDLIGSICKGVNLQDFYYMEPWKNIVQYYDSSWPRNFGVFKRTYIDTPWKAIALLAAIIVFLITVYQFFRQLITPFV
ncbi:UPF0481 protein At3g47200-like [Bidens hawaiensis]|uniref:UPF0481 protein At3g47200-like n=1 Tax=Bidens hawaiensis TaxID=980011 RepID=UPI00404A154E